MEKLRDRIINALYASIKSSSIDKERIRSLLAIISRRYSYTFMSAGVVNVLLNDIHSSKYQDDFMEYISEFHHSLNMEGITNTMIIDIALSSSELFSSSPIDKDFISKTNGVNTLTSNKGNTNTFMSVLYLLRMNMHYAYNYIAADEEKERNER